MKKNLPCIGDAANCVVIFSLGAAKQIGWALAFEYFVKFLFADLIISACSLL